MLDDFSKKNQGNTPGQEPLEHQAVELAALDLTLSKRKSIYFGKDQTKAVQSNKMIGRGSSNSSTQAYADAVGNNANPGVYDKSDIVFISAEGDRSNRIAPDFKEIQKAIDAGVTFITDDQTNRERPYNIGEREVADYLKIHGYVELKGGRWIKGNSINMGVPEAHVEELKSNADGHLIFNEKEIEEMMNIYAQCDREYGLEGDNLINLPYEERRKSRGQKLWEEMTINERKQEFFNALKMDLECVSKQIVNISRTHYIENRALDPLDPMTGFYKYVLVKLGGAMIAENGKIKLPLNLDERIENLELYNKRIIELISAGGLDQGIKLKMDELRLEKEFPASVSKLKKTWDLNIDYPAYDQNRFPEVDLGQLYNEPQPNVSRFLPTEPAPELKNDEAHVVELKLNADRSKALMKGGIDIGRPGLYGNPSAFGTTRDTDVKTLVEKYREWLMGEKYHDIEPDRRGLILESILKGDLDGKGLVCYAHGGGTCHGDVLVDFIKDKSLAQEALKLSGQSIHGEGISNDRDAVNEGGNFMFDELARVNHVQGLVNGHLVFNDKEIEAMMNIYAQYAIGYKLELNMTNKFYQVHRKSIGQKLWEDMTLDERKDEFFKALKNDLEITSKQVLGKNQINYLLDRTLEPLDPMAGFYKCVLLKLGATITEDGKIKLSQSLKEQFENYELQNKRVIDLMPESALDQSLKANPNELKLSLKLKLD